MKLLLLGGSGQIGWELQRSLAPLGELIVPDRTRADLARADDLHALVRQIRPDVIVNAAAYTDVDRAESEPELAHAVNAIAPGVIAERAAMLVHFSTDYVFDGSGDTPRDEDAPTAPLGVYGHSKLDGERRIRAGGAHHLIIRTSWVHAPRRRNFIRTLIHLARERETLAVVDDQIGAPTGADLLADVTAHVLRSDARGGTYHCTAAGQASRVEVAHFVVDWLHAQGVEIKLATDAIRSVTSTDMPTPAVRPLDSRLNCDRLQRDFSLTLPPWQAGVERTLNELIESA